MMPGDGHAMSYLCAPFPQQGQHGVGGVLAAAFQVVAIGVIDPFCNRISQVSHQFLLACHHSMLHLIPYGRYNDQHEQIRIFRRVR